MWTQNYDPFGNAALSTAAAALPVVALLGALARGVSAWRAAALGLASALAVAILAFGMPARLAWAAAAYGGCFGLFPVAWIVLAAVFLFRLCERTGTFAVARRSVARLSPDHRIQALLVAFSFGAFVEGAAGFGTPVAVSSALLLGLGFPARQAAVCSLLANTAPVAFGSVGTPILMLASVTAPTPPASDEWTLALSAMAGRQLPFFALLIPAWLVAMLSGRRGLSGVWPAVATSGGVFAVLQFAVSNYAGPHLVDLVAGAGSLLATAALLRFWQPQQVWRIAGSPAPAPAVGDTAGAVVRAWLPWAALSALVFVWCIPAVKSALQTVGGTFPVPALHQAVARGAELGGKEGVRESAAFAFQPLAATGTAVLVAAALAAVLAGMRPGAFVRLFAETAWSLRAAAATIALMMALAFVTRFGGTDATLGLALVRAGWWYPFFAPLLGWLGVALTGSDTSSNALFGGLQRITAERLGLDPVLICAANSTGGVMGKMIDAQSIVVATAATGQKGGEGAILRALFLHSLALAALMGGLTLAQAYLWPGMVPAGARPG